MPAEPKFTALKSYQSGHLKIKIEISSYGSCPSVAVKATADLTIKAARKLAADIIAMANQADEKNRQKALKEESRQKWRDREIAAGRMRVMTADELFRR